MNIYIYIYIYIWWVKEEGNALHKITRRKALRIGHILRGTCLLKHLIEGKEREAYR